MAIFIADRESCSRDFVRLAEIEGRPEAPTGLGRVSKCANADETAMISMRRAR